MSKMTIKDVLHQILHVLPKFIDVSPDGKFVPHGSAPHVIEAPEGNEDGLETYIIDDSYSLDVHFHSSDNFSILYESDCEGIEIGNYRVSEFNLSDVYMGFLNRFGPISELTIADEDHSSRVNYNGLAAVEDSIKLIFSLLPETLFHFRMDQKKDIHPLYMHPCDCEWRLHDHGGYIKSTLRVSVCQVKDKFDVCTQYACFDEEIMGDLVYMMFGIGDEDWEPITEKTLRRDFLHSFDISLEPWA